MISATGEIARELIRRLGGKGGFDVDLDVSLRETPIERLQALLVAINPMESFEEGARRQADSIRSELSRRQGESSL